jgi:predicted HicB family RNase H-like nuclease
VGVAAREAYKDRYTYRVTWSSEDMEWVGLCAEFPSLSWLAGTQLDALQGVISLVAEVIADMESNKETIPEPIATRRFSGKFTVRVTPDVHRLLATQAAESNVSFNRLVCGKLTTV